MSALLRITMPVTLLKKSPSVFQINYKGVSTDLPKDTYDAIQSSRIPDVLEKVGPFGYFEKKGVTIRFHMCVPSSEEIREFLVSPYFQFVSQIRNLTPIPFSQLLLESEI